MKILSFFNRRIFGVIQYRIGNILHKSVNVPGGIRHILGVCDEYLDALLFVVRMLLSQLVSFHPCLAILSARKNSDI